MVFTSDIRQQTSSTLQLINEKLRISDIGLPTKTLILKTLLLICTGLVFCISCTPKKFDTKEALWEYLKDPKHEYLQAKTINGVDFSLVYKPTDLLVAQELGKEASPAKIDSLRKKYGAYLYFNISMSKNNQELLSNVAGDQQQFGAMVNELAFGMEQKVHLYTPQKDTIAMADYIYPRMYGMSRATSILFVYPKEENIMNSEYCTLVIEDLGFYTGEVKFKIPTEIITNQPQLEF